MRSFKRRWQPSMLAVLLILCMFVGSIPLPSHAQQADEITQKTEPTEEAPEESVEAAEPTEEAPEESVEAAEPTEEAPEEGVQVTEPAETAPEESVQVTEPTAGSEENPDKLEPEGRALPAPKEYTLNLNFQDSGTDTLLTVPGRLNVGYYDGGEEMSVGSTEIQNGTESITLTAGGIYMFGANFSEEGYLPDMGSVVMDGGTEFWLYVSENGVEPVNADSYSRLMADPAFSSLIDSFFKTNDCYYILEKYMSAFDMYVHPLTEEKLRDILKEYMRSSPVIPVTAEGDGSYKMTLCFAEQKMPPMRIEAVDEKGAGLAVRYGEKAPSQTAADSVVYDSTKDGSMPYGLYQICVYGIVEKEDGSTATYIRKNAAETGMYPANTYGLVFYVGPDGMELVTPENYDELSRDPQFQAAEQEWEKRLMYNNLGVSIKWFLTSYEGIVVEENKITLPFTSWQAPTVKFKTVDSNKNPLAGITYIADRSGESNTEEDGMFTAEVLSPGLIRVDAKSESHEYMAAHELFRYSGRTDRDGDGSYKICLWVKLDGTVELLDDAKLQELCRDEAFLDLMMTVQEGLQGRGMYMLEGVKLSYKMLKAGLYIPGAYSLEKDGDAYLLPFTKDWDLTLSGKKDETVFEGKFPENEEKSITVTYECPEDGTYHVGWDNSEHYNSDYMLWKIEGPDYENGKELTGAVNYGQLDTVRLKKGTYRLTLSKDSSWKDITVHAYFRVFVEKTASIDPDADLRTADYIKDGSRYSNMVSFSCGVETEHLILARYPGELEDADQSWTFNVAVPFGMDYEEDSLKLQYLPNSVPLENNPKEDVKFADYKDAILAEDGLKTLEGDWEWTPADSLSGKTVYSLKLPENIQDIKPGDLIAVTYKSTVNTAAWYGAIVDSNTSFGYWSVRDKDGVVEAYDSVMRINPFSGPPDMDEALADPALCQVFGIKIYKYSNYDRMVSQTPSGFDHEVLLQEHLLNGAVFRLEGENLSRVIVIRDDLVELGEESAKKPAALRAGEASGAGAALAQYMDEETLMKLLYYRYEQGLQDLSKVSVAQTQTYYALTEDDLYTREAPRPDTVQFYADNGQGYRLRPSMFSIEGGEEIQAGDGGGLLLGGLGVGEYTLTEVEAPEGYALIQPMKISIQWVKVDGDNFYEGKYLPLGKDEVPDRSGQYGLICRVNGVDTPVLKEGGNLWVPGMMGGDYSGFDSIWNPICFVLVNPIGDDRISFAAVKEVNDPADQEKEFTLKFTIRDPQGRICTDVKYAVGREDGQFETSDQVIKRAEDWSYQFRPGQKLAFLNLPEGSTYEVTEEDGTTSQYIVSYENETGTIKYDGTDYPIAAVTNEKGRLTLSKTVTGAGDTSREFTFQITLTDGEGNELTDISCVRGEMLTSFGSGQAIRLKHGESATLYVPIGTHYKVTELEADKDGYTTGAVNDEGIVSNVDVIEVAFTNNKEETPTEPSKPAKPGKPSKSGGSAKPGEPAEPGRPVNTNAAATGDPANLTLWFAMLVFSASCGIALLLARKKSGKRKSK